MRNLINDVFIPYASYNNSHRNVKYHRGNIVNNVITVYGARWVLNVPR